MHKLWFTFTVVLVLATIGSYAVDAKKKLINNKYGDGDFEFIDEHYNQTVGLLPSFAIVPASAPDDVVPYGKQLKKEEQPQWRLSGYRRNQREPSRNVLQRPKSTKNMTSIHV
uniref:Uncharacterized protein n=1 Tax=Anopheles culicifacies TaxID=139723 RepID=A0A182LUH6_9DIPT